MYDELIKRLHRYSENCVAYKLDADFADAVRQAADAIEELQRQIDAWVEPERKALIKSLPKWVPVTERLPDGKGKYLCAIVCPKGIWSEVDYWDGKDWFSTNMYEEKATEYVTHWMPLPEPPKGE